jgi:NAD(P)-dependent dehydrogenase (short-subunit alcohol dehydrogenase family)
MGKLDGKVAIVTGGSAGIGLATAQRFAGEGAFVYLTGRRQAELESAVAKLGHGAVGVQGDVAVAADMERMYDVVRHNGHRIDVIVANAGSGGFMRLEDVTDEHVETLLGVNVKGALNTVQKALPLLNDGASIVLVTSMAATTGREGLGVHAAAKAAVRSFARTWVYELRGRNIRVNALAPGSTDTPAVDLAISAFAHDEAARREWKANHAADVPLGRMSRPEEQAAAALFLGSTESSYITGAELVVDGGLTQV